ncbi:hypothetical protein COOONC_14024 [Cooperia oncophora]
MAVNGEQAVPARCPDNSTENASTLEQSQTDSAVAEAATQKVEGGRCTAAETESSTANVEGEREASGDRETAAEADTEGEPDVSGDQQTVAAAENVGGDQDSDRAAALNAGVLEGEPEASGDRETAAAVESSIANTDAEPEVTGDQQMATAAESSSGKVEGFSTRYLNEKWIGRYDATQQYVEFHNNEWRPLSEDDLEFIQQLWYEQEAAETQVNWTSPARLVPDYSSTSIFR